MKLFPDRQEPSAPRTLILFSLVLVLFFSATAVTHLFLQNEHIYSICKSFVKTYEVIKNDDGSWYADRTEKPFMRIENNNLLSWDAEHYDNIRQHLYDSRHSWVGEYAFFPLFSLLWKGLHVGPAGICLVNLLLFIVGAAIMVSLFRKQIPRWMYLLVLCMPFLVIYAIPYSEALFFLTTAIGLFGLAKGKYSMYFVGFFLASMTRAAGNILLVAWLITDILAALAAHKGWKTFLRDTALHLAPVVTGGALVMLFQHLRGAEHWFEYIIAQKEWNKELSLPTWPLTDWSNEGESVTKPLLFILFIPALAWLALTLFRSAQAPKNGNDFDSRQQLRLLSVLFFVGNIVLALFTQKGCMYSQARLLTCTPFFLFLILDMASHEHHRLWDYTLAAFIVLSLVLCRHMQFHTYTLGLPITLGLILLVFFHRRMPDWLTKTLLAVTCLLNIFWTAYLFNCFMNGGWIFT